MSFFRLASRISMSFDQVFFIKGPSRLLCSAGFLSALQAYYTANREGFDCLNGNKRDG